MIRKLLTTAILSGFAAGIFISVIQSLWVTPLIYLAETFEIAAGAEPSHPGQDAAVPSPVRAEAEAEPWAPADGVERVFFTVLANVLSGIGFALLLAAAITLSGREVNGLRGALWGLAGFMVFGIAPAIGLPPDPPGVDAGPLLGRQVWCERLMDLGQRLHRHKLRARVDLGLGEGLAVVALLGADAPAALDLPAEPGVARALASGESSGR